MISVIVWRAIGPRPIRLLVDVSVDAKTDASINQHELMHDSKIKIMIMIINNDIKYMC
jgi:hypothetical protein